MNRKPDHHVPVKYGDGELPLAMTDDGEPLLFVPTMHPYTPGGQDLQLMLRELRDESGVTTELVAIAFSSPEALTTAFGTPQSWVSMTPAGLARCVQGSSVRHLIVDPTLPATPTSEPGHRPADQAASR